MGSQRHQHQLRVAFSSPRHTFCISATIDSFACAEWAQLWNWLNGVMGSDREFMSLFRMIHNIHIYTYCIYVYTYMHIQHIHIYIYIHSVYIYDYLYASVTDITLCICKDCRSWCIMNGDITKEMFEILINQLGRIPLVVGPSFPKTSLLLTLQKLLQRQNSPIQECPFGLVSNIPHTKIAKYVNI